MVRLLIEPDLSVPVSHASAGAQSRIMQVDLHTDIAHCCVSAQHEHMAVTQARRIDSCSNAISYMTYEWAKYPAG